MTDVGHSVDDNVILFGYLAVLVHIGAVVGAQGDSHFAGTQIQMEFLHLVVDEVLDIIRIYLLLFFVCVPGTDHRIKGKEQQYGNTDEQ